MEERKVAVLIHISSMPKTTKLVLYYGARYFYPTGAMWLPFEKYAGMSHYNYCSGNSAKFIDPDGMDYYSSTDENGK